MKRLTPLKAIRKYCVWCCNDNPKEPKLCPDNDCGLYKFRLGKSRGKYLGGIRKRCLDCSGYMALKVKNCHRQDCLLFPYRFGKSPRRSKIGGYTKVPNFKIS